MSDGAGAVPTQLPSAFVYWICLVAPNESALNSSPPLRAPYSDEVLSALPKTLQRGSRRMTTSDLRLLAQSLCGVGLVCLTMAVALLLDDGDD